MLKHHDASPKQGNDRKNATNPKGDVFIFIIIHLFDSTQTPEQKELNARTVMHIKCKKKNKKIRINVEQFPDNCGQGTRTYD